MCARDESYATALLAHATHSSGPLNYSILSFDSGEHAEPGRGRAQHGRERCRHPVLCFTRILSCKYLNRLQLPQSAHHYPPFTLS